MEKRTSMIAFALGVASVGNSYAQGSEEYPQDLVIDWQDNQQVAYYETHTSSNYAIHNTNYGVANSMVPAQIIVIPVQAVSSRMIGVEMPIIV